MIKYLKIYRLLVYLTSFTVFSGDIEKKGLKDKSSENDQLTGHFQSVFIYFYFFHPPTLNLKTKFP